jgi:hypothetical protein
LWPHLAERTRAGFKACVEVAFEPGDRLLNHRVQRSQLGEEMTGSRDDFQCLGPTEPRERVFVEFADIIIETPTISSVGVTIDWDEFVGGY